MNEMDRKALQSNYTNLIEVNYSTVSPHLISHFILDLTTHEEIESCITNRKKMEKLITVLPSRGPDAMKEFISSLRTNYSWISKTLEASSSLGNNNNNINASTSNVTSPISSSSSSSNGPNRISNLKDIPIKNHLNKIQKILKQSNTLCNSWSVLGNAMELSNVVMHDIRRDMTNQGGVHYALMTCLHSWIEQMGSSKATFCSLIKIVKHEELNDVTEELLELWATLQ